MIGENEDNGLPGEPDGAGDGRPPVQIMGYYYGEFLHCEIPAEEYDKRPKRIPCQPLTGFR